MMESSNSKKQIFYTVVLLMTLLIMIIGTTIAYFSLVSSQKEEGTKLYTGKLEINYIDGTYIKNPELWPMKKPSFNTYENVYRNTFQVTSSGTLDQTISVDLVVSRNDFNDGDIRYVIYSEKGIELSSGNVPQVSGIVNLTNNLYLASDGTAKYTLIIYLNSTDYNQNFAMGSAITGKLIVTSKQLKY